MLKESITLKRQRRIFFKPQSAQSFTEFTYPPYPSVFICGFKTQAAPTATRHANVRKCHLFLAIAIIGN